MIERTDARPRRGRKGKTLNYQDYLALSGVRDAAEEALDRADQELDRRLRQRADYSELSEAAWMADKTRQIFYDLDIRVEEAGKTGVTADF